MDTQLFHQCLESSPAQPDVAEDSLPDRLDVKAVTLLGLLAEEVPQLVALVRFHCQLSVDQPLMSIHIDQCELVLQAPRGALKSAELDSAHVETERAEESWDFRAHECSRL